MKKKNNGSMNDIGSLAQHFAQLRGKLARIALAAKAVEMRRIPKHGVIDLQVGDASPRNERSACGSCNALYSHVDQRRVDVSAPPVVPGELRLRNRRQHDAHTTFARQLEKTHQASI